MKKYYRYELARGNKRFKCPQCGNELLRRYIDRQNEYNYLPEEYGECQNYTGCGYHKYPEN